MVMAQCYTVSMSPIHDTYMQLIQIKFATNSYLSYKILFHFSYEFVLRIQMKLIAH